MILHTVQRRNHIAIIDSIFLQGMSIRRGQTEDDQFRAKGTRQQGEHAPCDLIQTAAG